MLEGMWSNLVQCLRKDQVCRGKACWNEILLETPSQMDTDLYMTFLFEASRQLCLFIVPIEPCTVESLHKHLSTGIRLIPPHGSLQREVSVLGSCEELE